MSSSLQRPLVFLASYPRSGNTFLRALLANFDSTLDRALTAEEIVFYGAGEKHEGLWRTCTQTPAESRTLQQEWLARGEYLRLTRDLPGQGPVMLKTHTFNGSAFGAPAFGHIQSQDRIVYVVRHPFDVVVSGSHFYGLTLQQMADRLMLPGAFNDEGGKAPFEPTGSWIENVAGWLNENRCPMTLVRYEELVADPAGTLGRLLQFLGRSSDAVELERAAAFSGFRTLQKSHSDQGFDQGPRRDRKAVFFRQGKADQWKTALPKELAASLDRTLGEYLDALGFERP